MDSPSSWTDMDPPQQNLMCAPDCCPMPLFAPNFAHPPALARNISDMQDSLREAEAKAELHRVLQSIQCSSEFGVYLCESFRDPRRYYIDDYWQEVSHEAVGIQDLHRLVGKVNSTPLSDEARTRLHQLARLLDRLARRIDRVVLA
jgi:hypothetical protein